MRTFAGPRMMKLVGAAAAALLVLALWSASTSAQPRPPLTLYGDGTAGDAILVHDADDNLKGSTTVPADGMWHVDVECSADKLPTLKFYVNGVAATAEIDRKGELQAKVMLTVMAEDAMEEHGDDEMAEEGDMAEDEMTDDDMYEDGEMLDEEMSDDDMHEDEMHDDNEMADDHMHMDDNGYPASGTGGLVDDGSSTEALVGTLALLAVLVAGAGVYQVRRRRA